MSEKYPNQPEQAEEEFDSTPLIRDIAHSCIRAVCAEPGYESSPDSVDLSTQTNPNIEDSDESLEQFYKKMWKKESPSEDARLPYRLKQ